MFEVLADPQRRRILELLRDRPRPVGELVALTRLSQPGVSKHLRIMREAGFVAVSRHAQQRVYRLEPQNFDQLDRWLSDYRALWSGTLDALVDYLDTSAGGERPAAAPRKDAPS